MSNKKRLLSLLLVMVIIITMVPWAGVTAKATYSGTFQFDSAGKFTVMQISDIQDNSDVDDTVISMITKAIARYNPDLVVLTGDNVTGNLLTTSFQSSVNEFLQPLLNTNTKFAVTFGNHDEEGISPSKSTQYDYYMSHGGNCAVNMDVESLTGVGSGVIPIYPYNKSSGTPAYQLYVMDSGDGASSGYDCPYTNQIDYYIQRSQTYPTVPSLWLMHIAPVEYYTKGMTQVPSGTANSFTGNGTPWSSNAWMLNTNLIDWAKSGGTSLSDIYKEPPCPANQSTYESTSHRSSAAYGSLTTYQAWAQYGNLKGCYVGHDHKNSYVVRTNDGIDLGYCKAATLDAYNDGNPGLRVFELSTDGTYTTKSVTNNDLQYAVGDYTAVNTAIENARFIDNGVTYFRANNINDPTYYNASSLTIGTGIYAPQAFVGNATDLADSINSVIPGLDTRYQSTINAYATSITNSWQALSLKAADYTAVNQNMGYTNGTAILAPPIYSTTHSGQWLPRTYYTNATLAAWDDAYNAIATGLKLPSQATVDGYASALSAAYQALRLRTDISYTVEYKCNGVKIAADKTVTNQMAGAIVSERYQTIPNFEYMPDSGDINGTKNLTLSLSGNVITFNYSGDVNITYKVEHYKQNLDLNGYTLAETETIVGIINSTVTGTGMNYSGFSYNAGIPGTVNSGTVTGEGTLVLKLYYTRNSYSITFNANSGTGGTSASMIFGADLTAPQATRLGYTFNGWSPTVPETVPADNMTFTAQWSVNHYSISFDADGGTGGGSGSMAFDAPLNAPDVSKIGYTFAGWSPEVPKTVPAMDTTYTAVWDKNDYTITFNANDGNGGKIVTLPYGTALTPPEVTKEGYDFVCWFPEVPSTVPASNATYTALWGQKTYTLTFDANGGTGGGSMQTLIPGEHLFAPLVLRTGYTFLRWDPEVPTKVPAENATYTAVWQHNNYTIEFDANGGTGGYSKSIGYGEDISAPEVSKPGYVFAGWTPTVPPKVPAEDMKFTAHWSLEAYNITFDANGGEGGSSGPMAYGETLTAPNVVKAGYKFVRWEPSLPDTVPSHAETYKAIWERNNYTIIFDANGGDGSSSGSYAYDSELTAPKVTKTGYTFVSWSPDLPAKVPAASTTYTAQWTPAAYTMTFDASGGTGGTSGLMTYGAVLKAPAVFKAGYTFIKWSPAVPDTVPAADATYVAIWSQNSSTITFDASGGTGGTSALMLCGSELVEPVVKKTGFTFLGWEPEVPETVPANNTTYTAKWSQNKYTINFDSGGGTGDASYSLAYGVQLTKPDVKKEGYTFAGWLPEVPLTAPDADTTYKAQWSINSYTLTFNANGGKGGSTTSVKYNSSISVPKLTKEGYTLKGWSSPVPDTMPANDLEIIAVWEITGYKASFIVDGDVFETVPTSYGEKIALPANPKKDGYIFLGWSPGIPQTMPAQDLIFTAMWYAISYTVKFNLNGGTGTIPQQQVVAVGAYAELPAQGDISKPNYKLLGWAASANATEPLASYEVTNDNITLYAVWSPVQIILSAKTGSSTVIDLKNSYIYGLEPGITAEDFENNFVQFSNDYTLAYTSDNGKFGTGTKVDLINKETNAITETYYIVIFGDVDGDGYITAEDVNVINMVSAYQTTFDDGSALKYAADLTKDGIVDLFDLNIIRAAASGIGTMDQTAHEAVNT